MKLFHKILPSHDFIFLHQLFSYCVEKYTWANVLFHLTWYRPMISSVYCRFTTIFLRKKALSWPISIDLSIYPSVFLSIRLSIDPSFYRSVFLSISLFIDPSFYRSLYPFLRPSIHPSIYRPGHGCSNSINDNPRLKVNQGVYFSTPRCCSTLIFGKTLHQKKSILKSENKQKKLSP